MLLLLLQIFNRDETGIPLTQKPPKRVAGVAQKHPYAVTSGDRSQITVMACASASGYSIPPMVIFDRKHLQLKMTMGEVLGTFCGLSDSGWMKAELFQEWFQNHFLVHALSSRPLPLLLDGHCSHYNLSTIHMAADEGITLFCLPPHTTHLLQPLDNRTFSSLKLDARMPAVLHEEPWKSRDTTKLYGDFSTSLGEGDGNVQRHWMLLRCRSLSC